MMEKMNDRMMWMIGIVIIVLIVSSLAGCITPFNDSGDVKEPEISYDYETEWFNDSHPFTMILRTGYMSQYDTNTTGNNSTLDIHINGTYRFEDRLLSESGYLNITITPTNSSEIIYYSEEWEGSGTLSEVINLENITGEVQIRIRAEGSDGRSSGQQQDYYDIQNIFLFTTLQ